MGYTVGELAKKLGVSTRTVRFYEEKKLLQPCGRSEAGYRIYDGHSAERLQKIIMLRFLDYSLEQISEIMQREQQDLDVRKSLDEQEQLLLQKREHIERLLEAVRRTRNSSDDELWDHMRSVIDLTKNREYVIQQYINDANLNKRISIHDYSTSDEGWFEWMFKRLDLVPDMKVLEIGCGNGAFWRSVAKYLPEGLEIHLTDYSDGMLESAGKTAAEIQNTYPEKGIRFVLDKRDATKFSYPMDGFDRIMANHMLYHLDRESRLRLYPVIRELLTDQGRFSCSLIGRTHMRELHEFLREYYPEIKIPSASFDIWLENAPEELEKYFKVTMAEEQDNDLLVPEEELVYAYVSSYSAEASAVIGRDKELFMEQVRSRMDMEGYMYIHKSVGMVVCEK